MFKKILLFTTLCLAMWSPLKASATECDNPESLLTDALGEEPDRLVRLLEGKDLSVFLAKLQVNGHFSGTLYMIDKIYVVSAKMLPGHNTPHVWLFFVQGECIVSKIPSVRKVVEESLP
jgi:hypothetical protein